MKILKFVRSYQSKEYRYVDILVRRGWFSDPEREVAFMPVKDKASLYAWKSLDEGYCYGADDQLKLFGYWNACIAQVDHRKLNENHS